MSDKLSPIPFEHLVKWILNEERHGKIFGYYKNLFFEPSLQSRFELSRFGKRISTPLGVAAGPHTQMSQNIILAWLFGARYIELKTVQVLDEIKVIKPCIDIYDEGYNCEWSQELKIKQSFDEYLNAWIVIHILKDKFGWNEFDNLVFNMSIGYDLKGIKSPIMQWFLDKMKNAEEEIQIKIESISKFYPHINDVSIPSMISNNVTLSTMHGCPPNEIERIGRYLIQEKKLHTLIKLNPTLLGAKDLRNILNDKLHFNVTIPDSAFEHDLKFGEAVSIINNLISFSEQENIFFGLKLTNTLESLNNTKSLSAQEKMVYMSGRALHPISINLAAKLQQAFDGRLDISFSAGADAFNFHKIVRCGLTPVTVCSDILKPGGYSRLPQYLEKLDAELERTNSNKLNEYVINVSSVSDYRSAVVRNLEEYSRETLTDSRYKKSFQKYDSIKTNRTLTQIDCIHAPCIASCAISQNIPDYMYHTSNKDFDKAFLSIINENPLPNITGMVCDHLCQTKCTRMNIDNSLLIREIKRFVSVNHTSDLNLGNNSINKNKIAIIGAGPSGLSAAYFLCKAGFEVNIFEEEKFAGGMVASAIPKFRIDKSKLLNDIKDIENLGAKFIYQSKIDNILFEKILQEYDFIYIAIGAKKGKPLNIPGENLENVFDQISFLSRINSGEKINLGNSVAIIGGGNSAIDAARTAKRLAGNVSVIYRRTVNEMPADKEEIDALLYEKIHILELTSPEEIIKNNKYLVLRCSRMKLSDVDESGRARPIKIDNSEFDLNFDSIITAIGQDIILDFLPNDFTPEKYKNVFFGGDLVRGADSLINAIADGKNAAQTIINNVQTLNNSENTFDPKITLHDFQVKFSKRIYGQHQPALNKEERNNFNLVHPVLSEEFAVEESSRCLFCDDICNVCVSVCPNLSNLYFESDQTGIQYPMLKISENKFEITEMKTFSAAQKYQIINISDFCNECGNCNTFCPTKDAPYKIKPRFSLTEKSFNEEDNVYFISGNEIRFKINGSVSTLKINSDGVLFWNDKTEIKFDINLLPLEVKSLSDETFEFDGEITAKLFFYLSNLKSYPLFNNVSEVTQ